VTLPNTTKLACNAIAATSAIFAIRIMRIVPPQNAQLATPRGQSYHRLHEIACAQEENCTGAAAHDHRDRKNAQRICL
jgi:hypothetical protein